MEDLPIEVPNLSTGSYDFGGPRLWTKARLEGFLNPPVEESLSLEYKASGALVPLDEKARTEITKDVSAFANSTGGTLMYGIAEFPKPRRHWPERLDPIDRNLFSKERLEQIIQTIQPRIDGIAIYPVDIDPQNHLVCYVVEIPASSTAHQARDHVYYRRQNFNVLPMEDYEVRDVMNRRKHPEVHASIWFKKPTDPAQKNGALLVKLENVSPILARHAMVAIKLPVFMDGWFTFQDLDSHPYQINRESTGSAWTLKARLARLNPLFPGETTILKFPVEPSPVAMIDLQKGGTLESAKVIETEVFADSRPSVKASLNIDAVLTGWTPCKPT